MVRHCSFILGNDLFLYSSFIDKNQVQPNGFLFKISLENLFKENKYLLSKIYELENKN